MKNYFSFPPRLRVPVCGQISTLTYSALCCTRCNACVQSCPSYLLQREEMFAPRGRVQLLRLILENKLKPTENWQTISCAVQSCALCARCTQACAGQIPLAHQMIALRRASRLQSLPTLLYALITLKDKRPALFHTLLCTFGYLRRLGVVTAFGFLLPAWLKHAHAIFPRKMISLRSILCGQNTQPAQPDLIYLPSFVAEYLDGTLGHAALKITQIQNARILFHQPNGLFAYLYGKHTTALKQAKNLLRTWEKLSAARPLVLLTESVELYGFLKNYPVLFANLPGWKKRAETFAKHVKFITDFNFSDEKQLPSSTRVGLDDSTILYPAAALSERAQEILLTTANKNMVHCRYSRFPVPVAGRAFAYPAQAQQWVLAHIRDVAQNQLTNIYCLSGWAALELNAALARYYPGTQAKHFAFLQTDYERLSDGNA